LRATQARAELEGRAGDGGEVRGMTQIARIRQDDEVLSPCVNVCRMDEKSGYCEGCRRTLEEIASWSAYSDAERRAVLALLPARKQTL
jgi:predicted Fe-S protein YdhL (DUF1289 family)